MRLTGDLFFSFIFLLPLECNLILSMLGNNLCRRLFFFLLLFFVLCVRARVRACVCVFVVCFFVVFFFFCFFFQKIGFDISRKLSSQTYIPRGAVIFSYDVNYFGYRRHHINVVSNYLFSSWDNLEIADGFLLNFHWNYVMYHSNTPARVVPYLRNKLFRTVLKCPR